jgi:hypothetical protein
VGHCAHRRPCRCGGVVPPQWEWEGFVVGQMIVSSYAYGLERSGSCLGVR